MKKILLFLVLSFGLVNMSSSFAGKYWIPTEYTSNWNLHIENGVIYITSSDFPSHCSHRRAQINIADDRPLDKALYSYLLAAYMAKQSIRIVVDSDDTDCVVDAAFSK